MEWFAGKMQPKIVIVGSSSDYAGVFGTTRPKNIKRSIDRLRRSCMLTRGNADTAKRMLAYRDTVVVDSGKD
jgi:uncharacterized protein YutE (UPF0331/DUF86 family)